MRKVVLICLVLECLFCPMVPVTRATETIDLNTTVSVERKGDGSSRLEFKKLNVKELNFLTSGEVKIVSLSPLKIEATFKDGETDIQPLLGFLKDLKVISPDVSGKITAQKASVKGLRIHYTPEALKIDAREITCDQSIIRGLSLSYFPETKYLELSAASAKMTTLPVKLKETWPKIPAVHIENLHFVRSADSLSLDFSRLKLTKSLFQRGEIHFSPKEKHIDLKLHLAEVDLEDMYSRALEILDIRSATDTAYQKFHIKALAPQGKLNISDLVLKGQLGNKNLPEVTGRISGHDITLDVKLAESSKLKVQSEKGDLSTVRSGQNEQQSLVIKELDLQLAGQNKRIIFVLDKCHCAFLDGGTADMTGKFSYPFHFKDLSLVAKIKDLRWADSTIDASLKPIGKRHVFSTKIASPKFKFSTAGGLIYDGEKCDLNLKQLHVSRSGLALNDKPLSISFLEGKTLKGKILIEDFRVNRYSGKDVKIDFNVKDDQCLLQARTSYCSCNVVLNGLLSPARGIFYDLDVEARDLDLPLFIGCFASQLPVYLTGTIHFKLYVSGSGVTPKQLEKSMSGEIVATIKDGQIIRLSHLDRRLKFILDALRVVRLNPSKLEDTLPYEKFYLEGEVRRKEIKLAKYFMDSPVLNMAGEGTIDLEDRKLTLKGNIVFKGLKKSFSVEQCFGEEK